MLVPGGMFLIIALGIKLLCWDTPLAKRFTTADTGKTGGASMWDYVEVLKDPRVIVMIFQYSVALAQSLR